MTCNNNLEYFSLLLSNSLCSHFTASLRYFRICSFSSLVNCIIIIIDKKYTDNFLTTFRSKYSIKSLFNETRQHINLNYHHSPDRAITVHVSVLVCVCYKFLLTVVSGVKLPRTVINEVTMILPINLPLAVEEEIRP